VSTVERPASGRQRAIHEARLARQDLGVGNEAPLPDMLELLEQPRVGEAQLRVSVLPLPEGVAGAYLRREGRPFFFVNSNEWPVRRRFTLAHEYGHFRLGHEPMIDTERDLFDRSTEREVEANAFAAEFLAPEVAVRTYAEARGVAEWDIAELVQLAFYFRISAESARYRLEDAGRLPVVAHRRRLDAAIEAGEHKKEAQRAGLFDPLGEQGRDAIGRVAQGDRRVASFALNQSLRAYEHGLVDSGRVAELFNIDASAFEELARERGIAPLTDDEPTPVAVRDEDW
jgi:Zn-dependent peptidase ImmA (M78 family)